MEKQADTGIKQQLEVEGIDSDIAEEVANMSAQERAIEADKIRIELGEDAAAVEAERTVGKLQKTLQEPLILPLSSEQQDALQLLLANGAAPHKAEAFLRQNPDYLIGNEYVASQVVESQKLRADKLYRQQAEAKAVKDAVGQFLTDNPAFDNKLPFSLKQEIVKAMSNSGSLEMALWNRDSLLREYSEKQASELADDLRMQLRHLRCPMELEAKLIYQLSTIGDADSSDVHNLILQAKKALGKK